MGKGGHRDTSRDITWDEVRSHGGDSKERWVVVDGIVYNITSWSKRHPGGSRIITHYAGQDASEAFKAFHKDIKYVRKYLAPIKIGKMPEYSKDELAEDFEELRQTAEKMGLFEASYFFYSVVLLHILMFEALAYLNMAYFGTGWLPYLVSVLLYTIAQIQVGWIQHDFGHLSVFKKPVLDRIVHQFAMGTIKGASVGWWNHMHYQHHAKPNVMGKDPDVRIDDLFVVGNTMPVKKARTESNFMPYNIQHKYFYLIGPPLLFPVYFQYMLLRHVYTRRLWVDFLMLVIFFSKLLYLYTHLLGVFGTIAYYFLIRVFESHWFVWVTQSNHLAMEIDEDKERSWVPLQMHATCDIEQSFFNDWFTGHLNFQCEHHLFPTMPRHNYYKIQPLVRSLCAKHGIPFQVKSLSQAFIDIHRALKSSGELWQSAYEEFHH